MLQRISGDTEPKWRYLNGIISQMENIQTEIVIGNLTRCVRCV